MNQKSQYEHALVLGMWLLFCAAVVYIMVVVGGVTRLTRSGLSMVEWEPIMGIIPPIGEAAWLEEFAKYRQSPEYLKVNAGMSLEAFKGIFYWEYGHRVLGRVIGLIYFIPFVFFLIKGMIPREWILKLATIVVLIGLQGLMGWYMVMSGLVDVPRVSQYRLTAHFGLAIIIFIAMLWFAMDFLRGDTPVNHASSVYLKSTMSVVVIVFLMMLSGGFVAGTKAGYIMNTFPLMNGQWVPDSWLAIEPAWLNFFENPVTIQFVHRFVAVIVTIAVLASFLVALKQRFFTWNFLVLAAMIVQVNLGIMALVMKVPVHLGAAHQAGAVALLSAALFAAHVARKGRLQTTAVS